MSKMLTQLRKSINRKVTLDKAIISDILLWLFLVLLLAYAIYFFFIALPARRGQTINLYFRNANEISRGAPVRFMGTDIGFVDAIAIEPYRVRLTVQTYPEAVYIPSGAVFTILYTGLGGAKSIEVSLPDGIMPEEKGVPEYTVQEPYSMRDTLNASLETVRALQKGSENISDFFGKRKPVEELQENIQQAELASGVVLKNTTSLHKVLNQLTTEVDTYTGLGLTTMQRFNHGSAVLNRSVSPELIRLHLNNLNGRVNAMQRLLSEEKGLTSLAKKHIAAVHQANLHLNDQIRQWDRVVQHQLPPRWFIEFEQAQALFFQGVTAADAKIERIDPNELIRLRTQIQQFNQHVQHWTHQVEKLQSPPVPPSAPSSSSDATLPTRRSNYLSMLSESGRHPQAQPDNWRMTLQQSVSLVWDALGYLLKG